jgi:phosphohistidine phosphatase
LTIGYWFYLYVTYGEKYDKTNHVLMKTLYLVRHAKSSWADTALSDFDRPLNGRGKKDAPLMGEVLQQQHILPQLLLSSPAKRAFSTAKKIAKAIGYSKKNIQTEKSIYHADEDTLLHVVQAQDNSYDSIMLFGHNPGLTQFAVMLSQKEIENIPTCGVVCLEFSVESWKEINEKNSLFKFFDYPKNHK